MRAKNEIREQLTAEIVRIKQNQATFLWVVVLVAISSLGGLIMMAVSRQNVFFAGDILLGILFIIGVGVGSWYAISSYYRRKFQNYCPTTAELLLQAEEKLVCIDGSLVETEDEERKSFLQKQKQELWDFLLEFPDLSEEETEEVRRFLLILDNRSWG